MSSPAGASIAGLAGLRHPQTSIALIAVASVVVVGAATAIAPIAGVAGVIAVGGSIYVLGSPVAGALVLAALVPVVSGIQRGLPVPGFRLSEVLIVGIATIVLVTADRRQVPRWRAFDWVALVYVAGTAVIGGLSLWSRGDPLDSTSAGVLVGPLQFFLLYRAVLVALPEAAQRRTALRLLLLASVPVASLAILQALDVPGMRAFLTSVHGVDLSQDYSFQQLARATGPFPHWQVFGAYMALVTLLALSLRLEGAHRVIGGTRGAIVIAFGIAGVLATLTATPVLAVSVGALALGYWARQLNRIFLVLVVAGIVGGVTLGARIADRYQLQTGQQQVDAGPLVPQTIAYRWEHWRNDLLPGLDGRWLTGYGPVLPPDVPFRHSESLYIELLFRGGIILLAIYGFLIWALAARALRQARSSDPTDRAVARTIFVMVALLTLMHLIEPFFVDTGMPHVLWVLAALLFRQPEVAPPRAAAHEPQPAGAA